ncbi:MAG: type II secretion system protein [bacterium]|nr:type II secretion system protein [bacterium]
MQIKGKGFTLIELLIVIGILAILATITILVLNPAQLFAQARDSQRITDLSTARSALSLYLSTATSPDLGDDSGGTFTCGTHFATSLDGAASTFTASTANAAHSGESAVDGSGWIAVDLSSTSGGSPLATLPTDPINSSSFYYGYSCDQTELTFELNAIMESTKYTNGGDDDVESTDGGNNDDVYEVGSDPGLNL